MTSRFHTMTSDELRAEIARGNFPPIAGADDGTVEEPAAVEPEAAPEAEATPAPTVEEVYERHANPEPEAEVEEAPEAEVEEEAADEGIPLDQYNLALEIALDPDEPQYDDAIAIIEAYAPDAIKAQYGLLETGDEEPELPDDEVDPDDPYGLGDEATGIPEIDKALAKINSFTSGMEEAETQAEQEAQAAAEQQMAEAFDTDYRSLAGEDAPTDFSEMDEAQQVIAASLLGFDRMEDENGNPLVADPKAHFEQVMAERDKGIELKAITDYVAGKRTFKLPPATGRNASSTAKPAGNRKEAIAGLSEVFQRHANGSDQVSG
jgi:hypothetical protein